MQSATFGIRFLAGLLFINLFVYAFAGLALYQSRQHYEDAAEISTQNLAHSLAINVSGIFDKIDVGLFAVAAEVERQIAGGGLDPRLLNAYLTRQQAQIRDFEGIWIADAAGDLRWGTEIPDQKLVNIRDREYFQQLHDADAQSMVMSKPVIGRITKTWSVLLSRRINNADGSFAGAALGSLRVVDYFSNMFSALDVGTNGRIALRDNGLGLIVQHPRATNDAAEIGSRVVSVKTLEMIRANPEAGSYMAVSAQDNVERRFSYQKVSGYPLYLFVARSTDDFLAGWRREVAIAVALLMIFTAGTGLFAWVSYKRATEMLRARARERHDQEVARQREELARLSRVATVNAISSSIAHEISQPLTAILSNAQAAQRFLASGSADLDDVREILDDIVGEDERASEIIQQFRKLLKPSALQLAPVRVNEIANEVLRIMHSDLIRRGIDVQTVLADGLPDVLGDRVQLQQVLLNLILNAAAAMASNASSDRHLTLTTRLCADAVRISVADNGCGIPGDAERIFEPFYTTKEDGLGLGLAICRSIAATHNGILRAQPNRAVPGSADVRGTTFYLELPQLKHH